MKGRANLLSIFSNNTGGKTKIRPVCTEPSINQLTGFTPSYAPEIRGGRLPTPTFRPDGFSGVDSRLIRKLESQENRRCRGLSRGDL